MTHTQTDNIANIKLKVFIWSMEKKECFFVSSIFIISLFFIDPNGLIDVIYRKVICMMCVGERERERQSCEMCIYM